MDQAVQPLDSVLPPRGHCCFSASPKTWMPGLCYKWYRSSRLQDISTLVPQMRAYSPKEVFSLDHWSTTAIACPQGFLLLYSQSILGFWTFTAIVQLYTYPRIPACYTWPLAHSAGKLTSRLPVCYINSPVLVSGSLCPLSALSYSTGNVHS